MMFRHWDFPGLGIVVVFIAAYLLSQECRDQLGLVGLSLEYH